MIDIMPKKGQLRYITISIILLVMSFGLIRSGILLLGGSNRLDELKQEVATLETQKSSLEQNINYKQTNEYIEERARNDLSLIKPGEKVYVVVSGSDGANEQKDVLGGSTKGIEESAGIKATNMYLWFKLFF